MARPRLRLALTCTTAALEVGAGALPGVTARTQVWFSDFDAGPVAVRFTNGVWPDGL